MRLDAYDAALGRGLSQALTGGAPEDVRLLTQMMRGTPLPPQETTLEGEWACRTVKMGKTTPLTVYQPFNCTIARDGEGVLHLTKDSGSQRKSGIIREVEGRMIYLGTSYVEGSEPVAYPDLPDLTAPGGLPDRTLPDVAVVEQPGPDHVRIMFPSPWLESEFDILDLVR